MQNALSMYIFFYYEPSKLGTQNPAILSLIHTAPVRIPALFSAVCIDQFTFALTEPFYGYWETRLLRMLKVIFIKLARILRRCGLEIFSFEVK